MTCQKEQCTFSPESAAAYLPTSSSDTRQLSLLSGSPTPAKSCESEPLKDGSPVCMCGRGTFNCSVHPSTPEAWTSFMQASLVKTLASLESRQAYLRGPDQVFTAKSCVLLTSFDQSSSFWKTSQQSFLTDSESFSETWPRWGMTQGGFAYAHPMSERSITETDGSCWPTPQTRGFTNDGDLMALGRMCESYQEMSGMAYRAATRKKLKYWTTPLADDTGFRRSKFKQGGTALSTQVGGQLNPDWVGWLMGLPIGWANSKVTETRKCRSKQQQPTASLAANNIKSEAA